MYSVCIYILWDELHICNMSSVCRSLCGVSPLSWWSLLVVLCYSVDSSSLIPTCWWGSCHPTSTSSLPSTSTSTSSICSCAFWDSWMLRTIKRQVASCVDYMAYHVEQSFEMKVTWLLWNEVYCKLLHAVLLQWTYYTIVRYSFLHAAWTLLCILNLSLHNYYVYLTKLSHVVVYSVSECSVAVCIMRSEPPFWVRARVLAFW